MSIALITGSSGLVGAAAARLFASRGLDVVGVDNDLRRYFFGAGASTQRSRTALETDLPRYRHLDLDIRDQDAIAKLLGAYGKDILVVIHAAAQPSHDWAAREPATDFTINANGTLNLLEATRRQKSDATFVSTSR